MRKYITFDWAIKSILREKENFVVLEGLLTVLLDGLPIKINKILESEKNLSMSDEKLSRVDLLAEDDKGELYLFEVQYLNQYDYFHRMLYSTSSVITERLTKGEPYSEVKKVYSIHIVYFDLGSGSDYIYKGTTKFIGLNTNQELALSERQKEQFHLRTIEDVFPTYYLIKLRNFKEIANTPIKEWMKFLKEGEIDENTTVAGLKEAKEKLDLLQLPREQRGEYNRYISNLSYQRSMFDSAMYDGRQEGLMLGMEQGMELGMAKGMAKGMEEGMAKGMEEGMAKGMEEGMAKGREEGAMKERISNVVSLSKMLSPKQIAEALNIPLEVVEEILKSNE